MIFIQDSSRDVRNYLLQKRAWGFTGPRNTVLGRTKSVSSKMGPQGPIILRAISVVVYTSQGFLGSYARPLSVKRGTLSSLICEMQSWARYLT